MESAELLMNVTPNETRIALVEMGVLKEVHIERQAKRGIVGNIYKGRVTRVLPGMQSAFVDIGLEKAAFLHAADIVSHTECVDEKEQKHFCNRTICDKSKTVCHNITADKRMIMQQIDTERKR